jgi:hypothetical protein
MKRFIIVIIVVVIALFVYLPRIGLKTEAEYPRTYSDTIPNEYLGLFRGVNKEKLTPLRTVEIKFRSPISNIVYNKNYYIQVYKLDSAFNRSVGNSVIVSNESDPGYHYTTYNANEQYCAEFVYKLYKPIKPSAIYLSLFGENTRVLKKNDSICYYSSNFENFSIKLQKDADDDIHAEANPANFLSKNAPLEILFIMREKNLYLILLSVNDKTARLKPGMLYDMINKNNKTVL